MKRPNLRKNIAARIKQLRNGRDIKVFARLCDILPTNMYKVEAGKQGYEIETIAAICQANNITLSQFFEGIPVE